MDQYSPRLPTTEHTINVEEACGLRVVPVVRRAAVECVGDRAAVDAAPDGGLAPGAIGLAGGSDGVCRGSRCRSLEVEVVGFVAAQGDGD